jgi:molecular chaperone IbpA
LVQINSVESRLELALAGFAKKEVLVYTQDGKLFIEGQKEDKETDTNYLHKGLAQRSFTRTWTLADDTEVTSVNFEDGLLTVILGRIVPESHKRKDYL